MADDRELAELKREVSTLQDRVTELQQRQPVTPQVIEALGLDTPMGRRQAMALGILGGGAGLGALTAASQPAQADAVAADVGTQADPWQKVWAHAIESGDGADALSFDDAVAFDHEAVSSATTIGNVTVVLYDSSVAGFTLTIPSSLEINGMVVRFVDQGGSASSNNVTVENSSNTTIATIDADDSIFEVWWDGSNWLNNIFTERVDARQVTTDETTINQLAGKARPSSQQSIPSGAYTQINLGTSVYDRTGDVITIDTANNKFVLEKDGLYLCIASAEFRSVSNAKTVEVVANVGGSDRAKAIYTTGVGSSFPSPYTTTSVEVSSAPVDFIGEVKHDEGSSINLSATNESQTHVEVIKLG